MDKDIFGQIRAPYYLYAPPYTECSGGTRAIHYLCHALNLIGEEAYVTTDTVSNDLRTPFLSDEVRERHQASGIEPIVVYPEIIPDNPLAAHRVVRYLLNTPGVVNGQTPDWDDDDLIFSFGAEILPAGMKAEIMEVPLINARIYNLEGTDDRQRSGALVFINRYLDRGGILSPVTAQALEISYRVPARSPEELAALYKRASVLYTYEPSTACFEALLCGCPVVYLQNELLLPSPFKGYLGTDGCTWSAAPASLEEARKSVRKATDNYRKKQAEFWKQLENFISVTQATRESASPRDSSAPTRTARSIDKAYQSWLTQRFLILENASLPEEANNTTQHTNFHLFLRLAPGDESLLADTLESLGQQLTPHWHLDIVTTLPAPQGLQEIPCIDWHVLNTMEDAKAAIDELAELRRHDWLVEIPAGTRLDPLYLWRIACEMQAQPAAVAFFVDDDCTDGKLRFAPRFKPGSNPGAMLSSDLAGPLCISRAVWMAAGGTAKSPGSPWFDQLLRVAREAGWQNIKHVGDVLLTYFHTFPCDQAACLEALAEHERSVGKHTEITPISTRGWSVRPKSDNRPVSIAIISQGNLDLLQRCLDSLLEKTDYPLSEVFVSVSCPYTDPDLALWLKTKMEAGLIRDVVTPSLAGHAARCNAAVAAAKYNHVLLIREEVVVAQPFWIKELMGSLSSPDIAACSPRLIAPGSAAIQNAGSVLGLTGVSGTPYGRLAKVGDDSYLDCLNLCRDISTLPSGCMLVSKTDYQGVGGMDTSRFGDHHAETDLGLKLRHKLGKRLLYQPRASLIFDGLAQRPEESRETTRLHVRRQEHLAGENILETWGAQAVDRLWNPSLSLSIPSPTPETAFLPQWQVLPTGAPRLLVHTLNNGQGAFRVTAALNRLVQSGRATACIWEQDGKRIPTTAEVLRMAPDTLIVQHYIQEQQLATLDNLHRTPGRPFTVYTLDDLITNLPESNLFRKNIPANSRSCLKYALERCDRLIVSTDFLAETYRGFISDIRVIPNALEQGIWSGLNSKRRTSKKPRIGWAGGSTHHADLSLLKEVIEQTRNEAEWIFFGMCPAELRPLIAEFHPLGSFNEYPARLAALNLDIAVAPLVQHPFNQGKSNLRLLEYGILGICTVCTDIDPYRNSPACRVQNSPRQWIEAIRARLHDPEAREAEGDALKQWVHQHFLLENNLDQWLMAHLP
ncbi:glycosyltransferase [Dechloromonas sp. CZR5]|uniref:glycosyltransferase n=1 Tax=Dechloromonas sp. CZR5 TaxID=2608630 RepID=UPI00123D2627|nr:glycosyltransferase [Dechloromonas sp. CZR5]